MKERWDSLALREKQAILLCGIVLVLLFFYSVFYAPLSHKVISLRTQLARNQQLLSFMRDADQQLQHYTNNQLSAPSQLSGTAFLTAIEHQMNQAPLNNYPAELKQNDNDSVELVFKKINFDHLLAWLIRVSEQYHWRVAQIHITQSESAGIVSVSLILTST